jgi:hypothetical protein
MATTLTPQQILNLPMGPNDSGASTVRGYLAALLAALWRDGEEFSGKRPFGDSGWQYDLALPLVKAGAIHGEISEYGELDDYDKGEYVELVAGAIAALGVAAPSTTPAAPPRAEITVTFVPASELHWTDDQGAGFCSFVDALHEALVENHPGADVMASLPEYRATFAIPTGRSAAPRRTAWLVLAIAYGRLESPAWVPDRIQYGMEGQ